MYSIIFAFQTLTLLACLGFYIWGLKLTGTGKKIAKIAGLILSALIVIGMTCTTYKAISNCFKEYNREKIRQEYFDRYKQNQHQGMMRIQDNRNQSKRLSLPRSDQRN